MNTLEEKLLDVLPELSEVESEHHENPILGFTSDFPWDELSEKIRQIFGFDTVSFECDQPQWTDSEGFKEIETLPLHPYGFELSGYKGDLTCLFDKDKLIALLAHTLHKDITGLGQIDEDFQQALKTSFLLEVCHTLENLGWVDQLCPLLLGPKELPQAPQVVCRLTVHLNEVHFPLILLLSKTFVASWRIKHNTPCTNMTTEALKEVAPLWCSLELANIAFTYRELQSIELGDVVLLPSCQWDLQSKEGIVTLSCMNRALAKATVSRTETKIQEILTYQEASTPMTPMNEPTAEAEKELEKASRAAVEQEASAEEGRPQQEQGAELEQELFAEEGEEDFTEDEEELPPGEYSEEQPIEQKEPRPEHEDLIQNMNDIHVNLVVELGRFKKPIKELLSMTPGDIMKLGFKPAHTVDLMVNNQCIGRGELLKIGETVGVRILEIAPRA